MTIGSVNIKWPVWVLLLIGLGVGIFFIARAYLPNVGGDTHKVGINSWSGFAPEVYFNNGKSYDKESRNAKEFGLKVEFVQIDDRAPAIAALMSKEVDAIWVTTDVMSPEVNGGSDLANLGIAQVLFIDISRGADVIVGDRTIKNVMDARGKKVAFTPASASHTLLMNWLSSAGLTMRDIIPVPVKLGMEAAAMFQSGEVPIAVVWSPDDGDCYAKIKESHELFSTAKAKNIVFDGLIVRKEDLKDKGFRVWLTKLTKSWLIANAEVQNSESKKKEAAACFVKNFTGTTDFVVEDGLNKVRLCTYQDNVNLFGLNPSFNGVTGEELYTRMAKIYSTVEDEKGSRLVTNALPWKQVSDESIIEEITDLTGSDQAAEPDVTKFTAVTPEQEKVLEKAIPATSVKVIINFATGSAQLDDNAKTVLDREVLPYVKGLSGYRLRVEGNTDQVGNQTAKGKKYNEMLSYQRAQSVINYLIEMGKFDPNRFLKPVGNGSNNPIYAVETNEDERAANRRTEVSFINE